MAREGWHSCPGCERAGAGMVAWRSLRDRHRRDACATLPCSSTYTAHYEYDGEARLVKLTDWIDDTDEIRYGYDDVGRLVKLTSYGSQAASEANPGYGAPSIHKP